MGIFHKLCTLGIHRWWIIILVVLILKNSHLILDGCPATFLLTILLLVHSGFNIVYERKCQEVCTKGPLPPCICTLATSMDDWDTLFH